MSEGRLLHHATRMAAVTFVSRVTGYVRDKALAYVLGAEALNDAFRTAFRIPNAFRALLAEGALHAAFVPALSKLGDGGEEGAAARELVRGVSAALMLVLAVVVGGGIAASPWLVRLYAEGFAADADKLATTVWMNRLMFPYLGLISMAALCQGVLNSRERFLLPAMTPILFNAVVVVGAWVVARHSERAPTVLAVAVLVGGALQFAVQLPAVRRLGFSLRPLWSAMRSPAVRRVSVLMLPGVVVLGLNQINQLITSRFASFLGDGAVTAQFYAYRVTELMYGGLIVQLTTVLLPVLSRELRERPASAPGTLLGTVRLVSFVTLPSAAILLVASRPLIGLLFGGGAFDATAIDVTARTLAAYAVGLIGTAHAKVMASAYFAHGNTRTPMVGTAVTLVVFTAAATLLVGPFGVPGLGLANTIAMAVYAGLLTIDYVRRYGLGEVEVGPTWFALGRQAAASAVCAAGVWLAAGWLAPVTRTGAGEALRVGLVLAAAGAAYVGVVAVTGGREPRAMFDAVRGRGMA